ncbi:hypothetical protein ACKWTF_013543 [Chironomus riparius]
MGPVLLIIVGNPEDAKIVLTSKDCIEKPNFMKFFGAPESILFGDYGPWHAHRKILNPYFNAQGVKALIPLFNKKTRIFMDVVKEMEGKEEFNIFYYLTSLALETITKVMDFDVNILNLEKVEREGYIHNLREFFKAVSLRIFKTWLHPEIIYQKTQTFKDEQGAMNKSAMKFTREIINNARKKINDVENNNFSHLNNNNNYADAKECVQKNFMNDLINNKLEDKEIFDEVKTILVAAQDTTANSSSSVLLLLAMHKDIQDKVVAELHQIFGKSLDAPFIDQEQLNQLQYMDLVINEAMRLMPVVPIVFRKVNNEVTLSDGCILPKGGNIIIPIYKIHHSKDIWGNDAEQFRPDRFEKENLEKIHPYAFMPFTKGPRMCLGYRYAMTLMKIQLVNFLMRYEVDTSLKFEELEYELNTTLNVCQGYMISIKKRQT